MPLVFVLVAALSAAVPASAAATEGFVDVEPGVRLHYFRVGEGKQAIVAPMGSWLLDPLTPLARADRTLILYDTRGRGRSSLVDASKVSFANEVSDLEAVRRHFGLDTMALMGWSHYGMMTAVYTIQNPGRVTRLVQITPGTPRSEPYLAEGMTAMNGRVDAAALQAAEEKQKAGGFPDAAAYCRALKKARRAAFYANPAAASRMTFDECALATELPAAQGPWWDALFSSMAPWDYVAQARASKVPRLVIQGEKDFIPAGGSREWAQGNPDARLLVMPGIGHHPFVEDPAAFFAAVNTFLDGGWPAGAVAVPAADPPKTPATLAREARAAYDAGDKAGFLRLTEQIAVLRPGDVFVLYNLACGQALNGQTDAAVRTLQQIVAHRSYADLDADTDFDSIRQTEGYRKARAEMAALRTQEITSGAVVAFTIPEKGLVPEGVAYDPKTTSFFVSSIRRRKVVRVDANGRVTDFVKPAQGGLRSAAGIAADPKSRSLWIASEAMPHMEGFRKGDPPASALFEFDLDTGKLRRELRPPVTDPPAAFDDLTVAADGRVYVNDGRNPRIWTLAPGASALELFVESDAFRGTQGLASTPDGKSLYVSDYSRLFRVDVASKRVTPLAVPPDAALNGADGLVYSSGSLYGIQNGVEPHRVTRIDLGGDGVTIIGAKILVMNHPDFDEPTLGVAADGALYFTANSQGGKFQDEKKPITPDAMRDAVILKLPLAPPAAR